MVSIVGGSIPLSVVVRIAFETSIQILAAGFTNDYHIIQAGT